MRRRRGPRGQWPDIDLIAAGSFLNTGFVHPRQEHRRGPITVEHGHEPVVPLPYDLGSVVQRISNVVESGQEEMVEVQLLHQTLDGTTTISLQAPLQLRR